MRPGEFAQVTMGMISNHIQTSSRGGVRAGTKILVVTESGLFGNPHPLVRYFSANLLVFRCNAISCDRYHITNLASQPISRRNCISRERDTACDEDHSPNVAGQASFRRN